MRQLFVVRRCFIVGMPGTQKREVGSEIAKHFKWEYIHVGDLLAKEVSKKTDKGVKIQKCLEDMKFGKLKSWSAHFFVS